MPQTLLGFAFIAGSIVTDFLPFPPATTPPTQDIGFYRLYTPVTAQEPSAERPKETKDPISTFITNEM